VQASDFCRRGRESTRGMSDVGDLSKLDIRTNDDRGLAQEAGRD